MISLNISLTKKSQKNRGRKYKSFIVLQTRTLGQDPVSSFIWIYKKTTKNDEYA